jgi:hypothetical protein
MKSSTSSLLDRFLLRFKPESGWLRSYSSCRLL